MNDLRRPRRVPGVAALLLLTALWSGHFAAQEQVPSQGRPLPSDVTEQVQVLLLQVNFLATDRRGRPVTDLAIDEIEVLDRGELQRIASFEPYYAPGGVSMTSSPRSRADSSALSTGPNAAPVASPRPRWILLVFDNYASAPGTRVQSIEAARLWVEESMRSDDLVAVISFDGELRVLQPFTEDRVRLSQAFDRALQRSDRAISDRYRELDSLMRAMERCRNAALPASCAGRLAGAYEDDRRREADALMSALTQLLRSVGSIPDSKMLVLFSNGFARSTTADAVDAARAVLSDRVADHMVFGQGARLDDWYDRLVAAAVRARVSVFTINPGGAARNSSISAERAAPLDESVNRFQVDVYRRSDLNFQAALADMARRTGGTASQNADALDALRGVIEQTSGLYTVGFYPGWAPDSSPHRIKIRVKRKGVQAAWPREVPRLPPLAPIRGEMTLEPASCTESGRRALTLKLHLEVDSLTFERLEDRYVNDFSVYIWFQDVDGLETLHRDYRFFNIRYGESEFRDGGLPDPELESTLIVPCRPLLVRAAAVDAVGGGRADFERQLPR